jgi:hypothetical protein
MLWPMVYSKVWHFIYYEQKAVHKWWKIMYLEAGLVERYCRKDWEFDKN